MIILDSAPGELPPHLGLDPGNVHLATPHGSLLDREHLRRVGSVVTGQRDPATTRVVAP